uniref:RBR-type E3 ubiquitin transferase n=1 Tax=Chromera velia CCMP2878 TaxID=1169474 RepID=A0A0G4I4J0_9ALVE|eukprot:Cvel_10925.t1-p1 / transcript=Cvel_10925.t1 / gene=Cvel_10925 / organism=Chromera_velia_CCMP2878 / gene_product=Probable E3 ubiquitin-protein ligase rbrA, putative / transcript_product=Probable E3 ubiquitin-protein ligase rbrA, putative / location=Cvel_scaffold671:47063-48523(-) / protein_length=487 / sequence_SO=supercontig / SO=protein_coding / is_pseudo=false
MEAQDAQVREVMDLTGLTESDAFTLLKAYGWNFKPINQAFLDLDDPNCKARRLQMRIEARLVEEGEEEEEEQGPGADKKSDDPNTPKDKEKAQPQPLQQQQQERPKMVPRNTDCPICLDPLPTDPKKVIMTSCKHAACVPCWGDLCNQKAETGKGALLTKCPVHGCSVVVPSSVFYAVCDHDQLQKYEQWYRHSFVDDNSKVQWCPKDCGRAVVSEGDLLHDVACDEDHCGHRFCFNCSNEAHEPAACETVKDWMIKGDGGTNDFMEAHTRPCPNCKKRIQKNDGCNHMICSKDAGGCDFHFCWMCLKEWKGHDNFYQCKEYNEKRRAGVVTEVEEKERKAKASHDKYMLYVEKHDKHAGAINFFRNERKRTEETITKLYNNPLVNDRTPRCPRLVDLKQCFMGACKEIALSRQTLKWSYPHAYYITDEIEQGLFECSVEALETHTALLQTQLEKSYDEILTDPEVPAENDRKENFKKFLRDFRSNL